MSSTHSFVNHIVSLLKPYLQRLLPILFLLGFLLPGCQVQVVEERPSPPAQAETDAGVIVLNPFSGEVTTIVEVNGEGWPAGAEILISINIDGDSYSVAEATAGPDGTFRTTFVVPDHPALTTGTEQVIPVVAMVQGRDSSAQAYFTVSGDEEAVIEEEAVAEGDEQADEEELADEEALTDEEGVVDEERVTDEEALAEEETLAGEEALAQEDDSADEEEEEEATSTPIIPTPTPRPGPSATATEAPTAARMGESLPTRAPTRTSTPTRTPTPTLALPRAVIAANALNVREGPGIVYPIIGVVRRGETFVIVGRNGGWWLISFPSAAGDQGWVSSYYTETENVFTVPMAMAPPTPILPTPTFTRVPPTVTPVPIMVCNPGEWSGCGGRPPAVSCLPDYVSQCTSDGVWGQCVWDPGFCWDDDDDDNDNNNNDNDDDDDNDNNDNDDDDDNDNNDNDNDDDDDNNDNDDN